MAYGFVDVRTGVLIKIPLKASTETFSEAYQNLLDMQDGYLLNDRGMSLGDVYTGELKDITIISQDTPFKEQLVYEVRSNGKIWFDEIPEEMN